MQDFVHQPYHGLEFWGLGLRAALVLGRVRHSQLVAHSLIYMNPKKELLWGLWVVILSSRSPSSA